MNKYNFVYNTISYLAVQAQTYPSYSPPTTDSYGSQIVTKKTFSSGLTVIRARAISMSGANTKMFFHNIENESSRDESYINEPWHEYSWLVRGESPQQPYGHLATKEYGDNSVTERETRLAASVDLSEALYNYIVIRKGNQFIYDIRKNFKINNYDYTNANAHGGNSVSLLVDGPREFMTGNNVIDPSELLHFNLSVTAYDGFFDDEIAIRPEGNYSKECRIDYVRHYSFDSNENLNTTPDWRDEFNNGSLDTSAWTITEWFVDSTQLVEDNIRFDNGKLVMKVSRQGSEVEHIPFTFCNKIALRADNGQYVCSENGNSYMNSNRNWVRAWEEFDVQDLGNNQIALRANNGKYVCSEDGRQDMTSNRTKVGAWEKFTYIPLRNNKIALLGSNNKYVSQGTPMDCTADTLEAAEKFAITYLCD